MNFLVYVAEPTNVPITGENIAITALHYPKGFELVRQAKSIANKCSAHWSVAWPRAFCFLGVIMIWI